MPTIPVLRRWDDATAAGSGCTASAVPASRAWCKPAFVWTRGGRTRDGVEHTRGRELRRIRGALPALVLLASTMACSIAEVATTEPAEILIVEGVLRPDHQVQRILLHPTLTTGMREGPAAGATVVVTGPGGARIPFQRTEEEAACLDLIPEARFACHVSSGSQHVLLWPGQTYDLEVTTRDGDRAFARTRIPDLFDIRAPALDARRRCTLPPDTPLEVVWSRSEGTWSYVAEMQITGLRDALAGRVPGEIPDSISLTGLAISAADTTIVLPSEFGIFERTQFDQPLLIALRDGLPAGVNVRVIVAAADRNYVNGVRGGTFNPSGRVRVPSVAGAATGVFGSLVARSFGISVGDAIGTLPSCLPGG
jgi:hypothetical protein